MENGVENTKTQKVAKFSKKKSSSKDDESVDDEQDENDDEDSEDEEDDDSDSEDDEDDDSDSEDEEAPISEIKEELEEFGIKGKPALTKIAKKRKAKVANKKQLEAFMRKLHSELYVPYEKYSEMNLTKLKKLAEKADLSVTLRGSKDTQIEKLACALAHHKIIG
jgi:hypothetical protein